MRGDSGKSLPVLRDFIVEILAPHTPEKPMVMNPQVLSNEEPRQSSVIHFDGGFTDGANQAMGWTPLYKPVNGLSESASNSNSSILHQDGIFNGADPMAHWRGMSFSNLLALNHGFTIPIQPANQEGRRFLGGLNQRTEIQQMNAFPSGSIPVFAPATPGNAAPGKPFFPSEMQPSKQNKEACVDDLLGINKAQQDADSIPIERKDPDYTPDLDLNKTSQVSQQKPRRKKHRPKVVSEAKPKKTPTSRTPKATNTNETPRPNRTCIRKSKATTPPDSEVEALDCKAPDRVVRSCRKSLHFDLGDADDIMEAVGEYSADVFMNNETPSTDEIRVASGYESGRKMKNLTAISLQDSTEAIEAGDFLDGSPYYNTRSNLNKGKHNSSSKRANSDDMVLASAKFSCNHEMYFPKIHKKRRTEKVLKPNTSHMLSFRNTLENIRLRGAKGSLNWPKEDHGYFPKICKKRRSRMARKLNTSLVLSFMHAVENIKAGTGQNYRRETASHSKYYSIPVPDLNISAEESPQTSEVPIHQEYTQITKWGDMDKLYKRFIAPTCFNDLDAGKGFTERKKKLKYQAKGRVQGTWKKNVKTCNISCMEASPKTPKLSSIKKNRRKSGKKNSAAKVVTSSFNVVYTRRLNSYNDKHFTRSKKDPFLALPWKTTNTTDIDDIIEGMKQLSINRDCSIVQYQEKNTLTPFHDQNQHTNALVVYQRDDTMIPFERNQTSKRRERAKVDLDDETNRVWNLLLEDINSQGIDGTDEEKTKWWEDERKVFRGRVDSFIARMRLVQGDRRFSPWKGSVVDSVVGVFLTQNVSDHLSSSAFMSLAARYPSKSETKTTRDFEEEIGPSVKEQEICIVELDDNSDNLTLSEKTVEGHLCDMNCRTVHNSDVSEEKVVNSKASHLCGVSSIKESVTTSGAVVDREIDDLTSSQHSVISQSSVESPSVPKSSEDRTNSSASFAELLNLADTLDATYTPIEQIPSCQGDLLDQEEILKHSNPSDSILRSKNDTFSNVPIKCPTIYQLQSVKEQHVNSVNEESSSVNTASSAENLTSDPCTTVTESATEFLHKKTLKGNSVPSPSAVNADSFYVIEEEEMFSQSLKHPIREQQETINPLTEGSVSPQTIITLPAESTENSTVDENLPPTLPLSDHNKSSTVEARKVVKKDTSNRKTLSKKKKASYDWDSLRKQAQGNDSNSRQRTCNTMDSIDWEAIRHADVSEIAETIRDRGMNNMLAERIKEFLDRVLKDHGSIDLEWLRDVEPDKAKEYLLSIRGLGLKSVECVRLLTLHHLAFPVDTNVGRIAVRLGWVPLQPLPESLQLHLLELYPVLETIQKYLWPRLCKLDQKTLYELHYHLITFGKVFCTKRQPNCNACPLRGECRHFASAFASARLALPGPQDKSIVLSDQSNLTHQDPQVTINPLPMPLLMADHTSEKKSDVKNYEPIVEIPASPERESEHIQTLECDIEDAFSEDPNEIPTVRLNMEEFTHTLQAYMQSNKELEGEMSKALVALASGASIPTPKLKNVNRLRTEHHVYELPDTHCLLRGLDRREPDDPCPYLLAIWSPGETANSRELPEKKCNFLEPGQLCNDETCFYCSSQREANSQIVRGTLLIPCRTAMRGSFPLNGTYFQVNEVFADHDSSLNPIKVPRALLWNLPRRTVYFGTSIPTLFKGFSMEGIQHCFWRGYVCVRGFDQKTRAPRPLMARLHFPASKSRARGRRSE